ncbi:TPA: LOW QUALITY PROTEIN: hypothetical protein N0F65_007712 [Lagenidium giganteum]|uniref:Adenine DNA glycosylase n=1 Tax=Lagenidium giganteum TaxID=4803 RepID=A0AAV2YZR9_9STRA|nr:TPA: LOW QUALITY PROTEIN: hypothetical protein N0F65_007712 [Lagenidium giganteum]
MCIGLSFVFFDGRNKFWWLDLLAPSTSLVVMATSSPEPDIEDLIAGSAGACKKEHLNDQGENVKNVLSAASLHDFGEREQQEVVDKLVAWYDTHRRKLPWRGDPPPYVSTATHTKQRGASSNKSSGNTLDRFCFVKKEPEEAVGTTPNASPDDQLKQEPRTVAPYETWVSEIMLQQTRVDTVVDYFLRWIDKFPTVEALADASEEDVNALWAGLGYYRRARMLHAGAKFVVAEFGGQLPSTVEQLSTIPGIGPYTAGAIASIAFGHQAPLVDGNVIRVVARLRAVAADPKNKQMINYSWKTAGELVQHSARPGALNQALMELGATTCTAQNPSCCACPVRMHCLAYEEERSKLRGGCGSDPSCTLCDHSRADEWDGQNHEATKYPLKPKKNEAKKEALAVAVITHQGVAPEEDENNGCSEKADESTAVDSTHWQFLMSKRPEGGLLAGQWEFVHVKTADSDKVPPFTMRKTVITSRLTELFGSTKSTLQRAERRDLGDLTHIFSHVKHHMGIEHMHFRQRSAPFAVAPESGMRWMNLNDMQQLGITTGVKKILQLVTKSTETTTVSSTTSTKPRRATTKQRQAKSSKPATSSPSQGEPQSGRRFRSAFGGGSGIMPAVVVNGDAALSLPTAPEAPAFGKTDSGDLVLQIYPMPGPEEPQDDENAGKELEPLSVIAPTTTTAASPPPRTESAQRVLQFRPLHADDIPQLRQLHEEWFPIRYNQAFYDGASRGVWTETGGPLFARVVVEVPQGQTAQPSYADIDNMPPRFLSARSLWPQRTEQIVGAVTASTLPLTKVDDADLIDPHDTVHTDIMYILTLGSRAAVRRRGIASALLRDCLEEASRQPCCGAVYLHVKSDNYRAIRFYEKNGFQNLRYLHDYYMINGVRHHAYLYIRYVNGARPPMGWLDYIARPFLAILSIASSGWRKLVDSSRTDEQNDDTLVACSADAAIENPFIVGAVNASASTTKSRGSAATATSVLVLRCRSSALQRRTSTSAARSIAMDFQDLLNEVENVMSGKDAGAKASSKVTSPEQYGGSCKSVTTSASYKEPEQRRSSSKSTGSKNAIDDLLDMMNDENEGASAAVHPRSVSGSSKSSAPSRADSSASREEFKSSGTKKCSQAFVGGADAKRGLNTAVQARTVCSNLRCNECDFTVVQFPGRLESATANDEGLGWFRSSNVYVTENGAAVPTTCSFARIHDGIRVSMQMVVDGNANSG